MTPSPLTKTDTMGYFATTGIGPDLMEASRQAIRHMVDVLVHQHRLTREEAYVLCSVAVDLKISEIVDAPNWIVAAYLPLSIFS
jgi:acetamidase/formamidase